MAAIERYLTETSEEEWVDSITLKWFRGGKACMIEAFAFKGEQSERAVKKLLPDSKEARSISIDELLDELTSRIDETQTLSDKIIIHA